MAYRTRRNKKSVYKRKINRRKTHKHKQKGGRNIGANCTEPNFSIFNTNLLKLFPYKA